LQLRYKLTGCKIISKFVAAFLVLLLLLSITPKIFLHEIFADHKDAQLCNDTNVEGPCIHEQGYKCQQSDIVVPHVYLISQSQEIILHSDFCSAESIFYLSSLTRNYIINWQGRAPPAQV
jgi:hypothetical protein